MTWVKKLKREYSEGKRQLVAYRDSLRQLTDRDDESFLSPEHQKELAVVEGMIADMNYAIEWMRTGRQPNRRRGVDIRDAYKRSILMDMDLLPAAPPEQETRITIAQKQAAVRVLMMLSPRELECYLLHMSNGLSLAEIAKEMKVTKRSVQDYIDRAKTKVAQAI
ncbi:sigma factor-like helix-turn-helix DNA-binding protein [Cohnella suwonensis]|uniref:Sigma factor-like helix-turn-helix DNA-binding protein n=1 Tax=Cohnella suwonensis TaxID=696072 RepID=A0ABW0LUE3_9BACL